MAIWQQDLAGGGQWKESHRAQERQTFHPRFALDQSGNQWQVINVLEPSFLISQARIPKPNLLAVTGFEVTQAILGGWPLLFLSYVIWMKKIVTGKTEQAPTETV